MNLDRARSYVKEYLNIPCKFLYHGSRNQDEEFYGKIINCFSSVFVVETTENVIKTFSYNDFIIKKINFVYKS